MTETGRERLRSIFAAANLENRAVLLPYLMAGIPSVEESIELFVEMADAGADGFEVGIPYADPLMDGPVIMEAGHKALDQGVTVDVAFSVVRGIVDQTGKPVLVMTYVNPVLRHGIDAFFAKVVRSGASGVILADLPTDEARPFLEAASKVGLGMVLFAAPTTGTDRLEAVAAADPVFVYAIAEVGVTGERAETSSNTVELSSRIRAVSDAPIVFGVGIATPDQAHAAAAVGDGVIVGTAIVRRVLKARSIEEAKASLSAAVEGLVTAMAKS